MKKTFLIAAALFITNVAFAENLAKNGTFDKDIKEIGSTVHIYTYIKAEKKWKVVTPKSVNYAKFNAEDGAEGSKGCLEIDFKTKPGDRIHPFNSGVYIAVKKVSGTKAAPAVVKVTFCAKSLDKNPVFLNITRRWGGASNKKVKLSADWQKFEVEITTPYSINSLIFCPVNKKIKPISAKIMLDNIIVEKIGK